MTDYKPTMLGLYIELKRKVEFRHSSGLGKYSKITNLKHFFLSTLFHHDPNFLEAFVYPLVWRFSSNL